jgi:hypothetical protein
MKPKIDIEEIPHRPDPGPVKKPLVNALRKISCTSSMRRLLSMKTDGQL